MSQLPLVLFTCVEVLYGCVCGKSGGGLVGMSVEIL